ncbi:MULTISPECIES: transglycosylase SLT domain-containing protein [unclassified Modicisalibacter]|uniref:transglycosylase SLT domain-containing protein n=1 Tax=unclassified Modicisalibacter TaxID=2679913 RepID=UPI001CCF51B7
MAAGLALCPALALAAANVPAQVPGTLLDTLESVTHAHGTRADAATSAWIATMQARLAPRLGDPRARRRLLARIHAEARLAGLSPEIVLAVIQVESGFRRDAESSAGAQGLMQVMPFWKRVIGRRDDDLFDPVTNLRYGCTILGYYLRLESGDLTRALARYNGSLGETGYPERVLRAWQSRWWLAATLE